MAELIALLDLGSNAVRCVLARVKPGVGFRVLRQERTQTRLGGGRPGTLPTQAVDETLRAVRRFLRSVRRERAEAGDERPLRFIAIATAAVRDAANRDHLLGPLRREEGIDVRVLTGAEEARLAASAVLQDLSRRFQGVIADLGGGSLQLTTVRRGRIARTASVPVGTVRMTRRFVHADPPEARELRALRAEIRRQMDAALPTARRGDAIVGLGGTIRTLARMHLVDRRGRRRHRQGLRLEQADVTAIRARLEALPLRRRRDLRGLTAERADTIVAGAILVEEALISGGYSTLVISTRGVRDGVLLREAFGAR